MLGFVSEEVPQGRVGRELMGDRQAWWGLDNAWWNVQRGVVSVRSRRVSQNAAVAQAVAPMVSRVVPRM